MIDDYTIVKVQLIILNGMGKGSLLNADQTGRYKIACDLPSHTHTHTPHKQKPIILDFVMIPLRLAS